MSRTRSVKSTTAGGKFVPDTIERLQDTQECCSELLILIYYRKRLSDDKCQHLKDSLAAFVEEQCAFLEKAWNPENPDRLETQMNELVDDLVYILFHPNLRYS